jgi:hypothetical protein
LHHQVLGSFNDVHDTVLRRRPHCEARASAARQRIQQRNAQFFVIFGARLRCLGQLSDESRRSAVREPSDVTAESDSAKRTKQTAEAIGRQRCQFVGSTGSD